MSESISMNLHILKASGRLLPFEAELISAFNEVSKRIEGKLLLPNVDVLMLDNPNNVIPEMGIVGYAVTANLVYINMDPNSSHLKEHLHDEVVNHMTHELHHCARIHAIGYGKTLLEAMVSEGLADQFDIEINHHEPSPWSVALKPEQFDVLLNRASVDFDNPNYGHAAWFFGSEEKDLPRWAGYSLGFEIVRRYMEKSGKTAVELVATPAKAFVE